MSRFIVRARPNFMKTAPVVLSLAGRDGIAQVLAHTGKHYDDRMSDVFFRQLELPQPDVNLDVGSGSQAVQTAQIMMRMEEALMDQRPDLVLVYGNVNSTVVAALVCSKLHIPLGHVEAGLRSFDRTMPEEINRLLTDQVADLLFTPSADGNENLAREGIAADKIHLVGNAMIDTLVRLLPEAEALWESRAFMRRIDCRYALVTLHRPSNVDAPESLGRIVDRLARITQGIELVSPVHPRTRERIGELGLPVQNGNLRLIEPLGYLEFLALQRHAALVITDSGRIQEEMTFPGMRRCRRTWSGL
jgi:UDP-N-acetylglucosamine 2-epimerase (non-hydrolysing)